MPEEEQGSEEVAAQAVQMITAEDVNNGTVSFEVSSTAEGGSVPASGISPIKVTVPYTGLTPVSGALHVFDENGSDAAYLNIDPAEGNLKLVEDGGSTTILMVPKDTGDISMATDFAPVPGVSYTYTLDAVFDQNTDDGTQQISIQIYNEDPFNGNPVSEEGFSLNGSCMNASVSGGSVTGSVLFPSDGSASYATVTADGQSMANVTVTSGTDGSIVNGVTKDANDTVSIMPLQSGPVTLTITYYSQDPSMMQASEDGLEASTESYEGMETMDPAAGTVEGSAEPVGTIEYTIYFQ